MVRAIHEIDPEQPVYDVRTMDEWVDRSLGQRWMNMTLVGTFASVALALCAIGVYGVIAFGVARQRREFGIRLALGASRRGIATSVVTHGLTLAGIGIGAGLVLAFALTRSMTSLLFGVSASDVISFGRRDARDPDRRAPRQLPARAARRGRGSGRHSARRVTDVQHSTLSLRAARSVCYRSMHGEFVAQAGLLHCSV